MDELILTLAHVDERLLHALVLRRRRFGDVLARAVTRLGDPAVVVAFTLVMAAGLFPPLQRTGILALWTLTVSHLAVQLLKRTITRPRPNLPVGFAFLIEPEDRFSFPSGHAAAGLSVGLALFVGLPGPLAFASLALGCTVGISRCYLGVHYPSDVLVGWSSALAAAGMGMAVPGVGF